MSGLLLPITGADFYILLLDAILANPDKVGHGWEGIYFEESGEHSWYQMSRAIGEAMVALGLATDAEPTSLTPEELVKYFGSVLVGEYNGSNVRCRADRAHSLGWNPKHTTEDLLKSIRPEVEKLANLKLEGKLDYQLRRSLEMMSAVNERRA